MKIYAVFLLLFLYLCACKEPLGEKIDILDPETSHSFLELFSVNEAIPLDISGGLGAVSKIDFTGDLFYVLDEESSRSLQVFSEKGELLNKIQSFETGRIYDFLVDKPGRRILLATQGRRLELFSLDGSYLRTIRLEAGFEKLLAIHGDHVLIFKGNDADNGLLFAVLDVPSGKIIREFGELEQFPLLDFSPNQFHTRTVNNELVIGPPLQPDFIMLSPDFEMLDRFEFGFKGKFAPLLSDEVSFENSEGLVTHMDGLLASGDRLFFYLAENNIPQFRVLDLKRRNVGKLVVDQSKPDSFLHYFLLLQPTIERDGVIYSIVDVDYIKLFQRENRNLDNSILQELSNSEAMFAIVKINVL